MAELCGVLRSGSTGLLKYENVVDKANADAPILGASASADLFDDSDGTSLGATINFTDFGSPANNYQGVVPDSYPLTVGMTVRVEFSFNGGAGLVLNQTYKIPVVD